MIKNNTDCGSSLIIAIVIVMIMGLHFAFADENKPFEFSPYMDFTGSVHGGGGDYYEGFAFGIGAGAEALIVVNSGFAFGVNGNTRINYDNYVEYIEHGDVIVDDYGLWTAAGGAIVYVGNWFYVSYMAMINMKTFHEESYLSTDCGDAEMDKIRYHIDPVDYILEFGIRASYHVSVYMDITTHLVESELAESKYQFYFGFKYHI